jgi:hypothetical protein
MSSPPIVRARYVSRQAFVATGATYLLFCGAIVCTVALLTLSGFFLPPRAVQSIEPQAAATIPLATIQLYSDRKGLCRHLLFHNDTGRFDEGGFAPCRGLIPAELLVDTVRGKRSEAMAKVFKFR